MTYNTKPYKILEIKKLTPNVRLFRVKCNLNPEPGKFIQVSLPGIGECPLGPCSYDNKEIKMVVRNAGNVTSSLFKLKKGDKMFIRGPYGNGFLNFKEKMRGKNLIIAGGGTGIAPVASLIDYIDKNQKILGIKNVKIYFGFKDENSILLKDKINQWKKKFDLVVCLDKKLNIGNIKCERGFIHKVMKKQNKGKKLYNKETIALMCGPEVMMKSVSDELNSCGLKNENIYWSMERRMECAFGNCGRCLIQEVYVCKDGPVFQLSEIKPKIENEQSSNEYVGD